LEQLISKAYRFATNKKTIIGFFIVFGAVFIYSLWHRHIQSDENWFGEQAWYLAHEGIVRMKTMVGIPEYYNRIFIYHQLLIYMGALVIKLIGWSVYLFKSLTFLFYLVFFLFYYLYSKKNVEIFSVHHLLIASLLIAVTPTVMVHSFIFRPEIYVMAFGFISYFFLSEYLKNKKHLFVVFSAVAASLAFLTTFNASLFCVAGFFLLLFNKEYKALLIFSVVSVLLCSLSTIELWNKENFNQILVQINAGLDRKFTTEYRGNTIGYFIFKKILNLLKEPQRFLWSDRIFIFSSLFILSIAAFFKRLWKTQKNLVVYFIVLIVALNIFGIEVAERYLIYAMPYMAIISSICIIYMLDDKRWWLKSSYILLFAGIIIIAIKMFIFIFSLNNDHIGRHGEAMNMIPEKNVTIVAPWVFIYNEIGSQNFISYKAVEYYEDSLGKKMQEQELFSLLHNSYSAKYIVVQRRIKNEPDWYNYWFDNMDVLMKNDYYQLHFSNEDFYIFKAK
jgi:hypothetical protein